jgi:hypothetical protein
MGVEGSYHSPVFRNLRIRRLIRSRLRAHGNVGRAQHIAAETGERQAAFLLALVTLGVNDFGIGEHDLRFGILADARVHDG